jgi:hypothetical protein
MKTRILHAIAVLAVITGMAAAASNATAAVRILGAGGFTATSIGTLSFASIIDTLRCSVTLQGSTSSGPISLGNVFGSVSRVSINPNPCEGSSITALNTPWNLVLLDDALAPTQLGPTGGIQFGISVAQFSIGACLFTGLVAALFRNSDGQILLLPHLSSLDGGICGLGSLSGSLQLTPLSQRVIRA